MMALLGTLKLVPNPGTNMPKVFAGIIVFRVIYFLLPLVFAAVLVGWHEYALRKKWIPPIVIDADGPADDPVDRAGTNGHAVGKLADGHAANSKSASSESQQQVSLD